jgi:hypothetical protein
MKTTRMMSIGRKSTWASRRSEILEHFWTVSVGGRLTA